MFPHCHIVHVYSYIRCFLRFFFVFEHTHSDSLAASPSVMTLTVRSRSNLFCNHCLLLPDACFHRPPSPPPATSLTNRSAQGCDHKQNGTEIRQNRFWESRERPAFNLLSTIRFGSSFDVCIRWALLQTIYP